MMSPLALASDFYNSQLSPRKKWDSRNDTSPHINVNKPAKNADAVFSHPPTSTRPDCQQRRRVTFDPLAKVERVLHIDEYTDDETEDTWISPKEFENIRDEIQKLVAIVNNGGQLEENDDTTMRGLEYRTISGGRLRYKNKRQARSAVLDEQDRQWETEADDPEYLSMLYYGMSYKIAIEAKERGQKDELIANEINNRPKQKMFSDPERKVPRTVDSGCEAPDVPSLVGYYPMMAATSMPTTSNII
jgi:hypothetical protein